MSKAKKRATCGARTSSGKRCKNPRGFRTDHPHFGRCYAHGGLSPGAPAQNTNAVTTGEWETLHVSALPHEQRSLYETLDTSPIAQAEQNLRLTSIREHRILIRINNVLAADEDGFGISTIQTHLGWNVKGKVDFSVAERTSTLSSVMHLEDALTRVQALKAKGIDQLRNCLLDNPPESGNLDAIVSAIDRSAQAEARESMGVGSSVSVDTQNAIT